MSTSCHLHLSDEAIRQFTKSEKPQQQDIDAALSLMRVYQRVCTETLLAGDTYVEALQTNAHIKLASLVTMLAAEDRWSSNPQFYAAIARLVLMKLENIGISANELTPANLTAKIQRADKNRTNDE